jgi:hypothetical protein
MRAKGRTPKSTEKLPFVVELRGRQYFVIDNRSGMTFGGPYTDRLVAMQKADALNQTLGASR